MNKGKKFLSDLKLYSDYLKWRGDRYENWEEACEDIINGHKKHFDNEELNNHLDVVLQSMKSKKVLASQRSLQYRNEQIERSNARIYNCSSTYAAYNEVFQKTFYLALNGCGVGGGLLLPFVDKISEIKKPTGTPILYTVPDTIEGWADSLGVLLSSYFVGKQPFPKYKNRPVNFDFSEIRPKGSKISGGFKAPGPDGLRNSLLTIKAELDKWIVSEGSKMRPILVADIICHASDAVLSGGIRRAALNFIVDPNDQEMINAKSGNWWDTHPHRARSNNSVILLRSEVSKKEFDDLVKLNQGTSDIGFVFADSWFDMFNPCFEIAKIPMLVPGGIDLTKIKYEEIPEFLNTIEDSLGVAFCNLSEINAELAKTKEEFLLECRNASILGTTQAAYTNFPYLGKTTEEIVKREALIGVSITGWMNNQMLFNPELLKKGASIVKETNKRIAEILGINQAARTTCVKPSGNASVILGTASGIHPEHSEKYFRIMQLNKETETAKWLEHNMPFLLEESVNSKNNTDYVVFIPIINNPNGLFKNDMKGVKHLEKIKLVQEYWVNEGTNKHLCVHPKINHNCSNTVIVDDMPSVVDYIWENKEEFTACSFISDYADKDFVQAPFTTVISFEEITKKYGKGSLFISGLITDGLHYFNQDLWKACEIVEKKDIKLTGTREQVLLQKYWISRVKKLANNYFNGDKVKTIHCIKDVHLLHKWEGINRQLKPVHFDKILNKPTFKEIGDYGAQACSGNNCEITKI